MLRGIKISLFCVIFYFSTIFPQEREVSYNISYPQFVPFGSSFDVSFIITNTFPEASRFELIILAESRILVNKTDYKGIDKKTRLPVNSITIAENKLPGYKVIVELDSSEVFQLLINFKSEQIETGLIKFDGVFIAEDEIIAHLHESETNGYNFIDVSIEFYKPQKTAEKSLQFSEQVKFELEVVKNFTNNLLIDFWIKINEPETPFLKILHTNYGQPIFELSTNQFQMLSVNSKMQNQVFIRPYFIGRKSWNHISVYFSKVDEQAYFYSNGSLIAKFNLPGKLKTQGLKIIFGNNIEKKSFLLDLLRIADYNNSIDYSFTNRHSVYFGSDSSSIAALYKFDSANEFITNNKNVKIEYGDVKFVKSDAPIFAQTPKLNIRLHSSMYELEWSGGDYKQAISYVLEKSMNGGAFVPVFTAQANNKEERIYSYLDAIDETSDVVYYRIRQNNYDGTIIYSSQVKVGQGLFEPFTLGQNFPNPFNPLTSIEIEMFEDSEVEITIFSLEGREIAKVFKGTLNKGVHKYSFDGTELPSGIYLYQVSTPMFSQTRKMILTK